MFEWLKRALIVQQPTQMAGQYAVPIDFPVQWDCGIQFVEEQHGAGPRHLAAEVSGVVIEIYPAKTREDVDRTTRLGFSIPDLQGSIKALEGVGAEIGVGPRQTQWGLRAVVKDPDGRSIELYASEAAT
jgi:lactoylglutathione lyase